MSTTIATAKSSDVLVVETSSVVRDPSLKPRPPFTLFVLKENADFLKRNPKGLAGFGITKVRTITPRNRLNYSNLAAEVLYIVVGDEEYFQAAIYAGLQTLPVHVINRKLSPPKQAVDDLSGVKEPAECKPAVRRTVASPPKQPKQPKARKARVVPVAKKIKKVRLSRPERKLERTSVPRLSQFRVPLPPPPPKVFMEDIVQIGPDTEWMAVSYTNYSTGRSDMKKVSARQFIQLWNAKLLQIPESSKEAYEGYLAEAKQICAKATK